MQSMLPAELLIDQQRSMQRERVRDERLSRYGLDALDRAHVDRRQPYPDPIGIALMKLRPGAAIAAVVARLVRAMPWLQPAKARP